MNVRELIDALLLFPLDAPVVMLGSGSQDGETIPVTDLELYDDELVWIT